MELKGLVIPMLPQLIFLVLIAKNSKGSLFLEIIVTKIAGWLPWLSVSNACIY